MGNYENGVTTRQAIVRACEQLFYEKGFHETSYTNICNLAHVNRGTIYYHFKTKETMLYEVQWQYTINNKHVAEKYCSDSRYHYIVAMCMFWLQMHRDEKMRKYVLQCCVDFPVYTGKMDLTHFYFTGYEAMWGAFWKKKDIPELAFASIYGYIMSCMRMLCEVPEQFDPMVLYEHCVKTTLSVWGAPAELGIQIWENAMHYLSLIPEEEIAVQISPIS